MNDGQNKGERDEQETARVRDEALRCALDTPPQPHKKPKGEKGEGPSKKPGPKTR